MARAPNEAVPKKPAEKGSARAAQVKQSEVPSLGLTDALRIPIAIRDSYNLSPSTPVDVGVAIGVAPTSGGFRTLAGASIAYGLTTGGYNAVEIALTELGQRIVAPQIEGDDFVAKLEAFERPRVINEFVAKYNGGRLPKSEIARNVLHGMGVPLPATQRVYDLITSGLRDLGYLREVNDASFVQRPTTPRSAPADAAGLNLTEPDPAQEETLEPVEQEVLPPADPLSPPARPNAIFLGHGKNKKPLEQLIKILDEYRIPHKEAIAEPNAGRPIPVKVAETMRECGAAILIFTADEKLFDEAGNEVWRPSENVVHELGAASVLYENRIIIFKEAEVNLASNFSSIGYISFEKDKLGDKGIDLFRELVSFRIVSISVGGS